MDAVAGSTPSENHFLASLRDALDGLNFFVLFEFLGVLG
jgi:hypothetical protein